MRTVSFQFLSVEPAVDDGFQGTWQFISTAQLRDPGKIYEVSDEPESFFSPFSTKASIGSSATNLAP